MRPAADKTFAASAPPRPNTSRRLNFGMGSVYSVCVRLEIGSLIPYKLESHSRGRVRSPALLRSIPLRVGIIGCGAISDKHLQAYRSIGYKVVAVTDVRQEHGKKFAAAAGAEF